MVLALLARKLPLLLATGTASVRLSFKIEPTEEGQLTPVIVQVAVRRAGPELETGRCSFWSQQFDSAPDTMRVSGVHLTLANISSGKLTIEISTAKRKNRGNALNLPLCSR